ncbi:MAG: cupredoxin domain-containing protein [Parcubacteria group bacterium]
MNNTIVAAVLVLILAAGGFFLFKNRGVAPTEGELNNGETSVPNTQPDLTGGLDERIGNPPGATTTGTVTTGVTREFKVTATSFSFSPSTITVNKGDTVKITLKNNDGTHNLNIEGYDNAKTNILNAGQEQTISFVASKSGTFQYYCSVGNHRAKGMVGTLTVR